MGGNGSGAGGNKKRRSEAYRSDNPSNRGLKNLVSPPLIFFKHYPVNLHPVNFNPVKLLPVDWNEFIPVNRHPVPQCWTGAKETVSNCTRPMTVRSGSTDKARRGMEQSYRRIRLPSSHRRAQDSTDRQASCTSRLQSGVRREEGGPGDRLGHKGSVYSGSGSFTN